MKKDETFYKGMRVAQMWLLASHYLRIHPENYFSESLETGLLIASHCLRIYLQNYFFERLDTFIFCYNVGARLFISLPCGFIA